MASFLKFPISLTIIRMFIFNKGLIYIPKTLLNKLLFSSNFPVNHLKLEFYGISDFKSTFNALQILSRVTIDVLISPRSILPI